MRVFYCKDTNFGDDLNEYLVRKKGLPFEYTENKKEPYYLLVGSLFHQRYVSPNAIVCGIGIGNRYEVFLKPKDIFLVRGPYTRQRCLELGYPCPTNYGDPALILPDLYHPAIEPSVEVAFLPHKVDTLYLKKYLEDHPPPFTYIVVDLEVDYTGIEKVVSQMLQGKKVVASSLHGIIAGHAYKKPTIWMKTHHALHGDGIKFLDHFATMKIEAIPRDLDYNTLLLDYPQPNPTHLQEVVQCVRSQIEKVFAQNNEASH